MLHTSSILTPTLRLSPSASTSTSAFDGRISSTDFTSGCHAYLARYLPSTSAGNKHPQRLASAQYAAGWRWCDGPRNPSAYAVKMCGGLVRRFEVVSTSKAVEDGDGVERQGEEQVLAGEDGVEMLQDEDEEDEATAGPGWRSGEERQVVVHQTIAWSATWRVPVLYFYVTDCGGRTLTLDELIASPVFHRRGTLDQALRSERLENDADAAATATATETETERAKVLEEELASFPPVSQGEDPFTGQPCLFLHPCETAKVLGAVRGSRCSDAENAAAEKESDGWQLGYLESFMMLCATAIEMRG